MFDEIFRRKKVIPEKLLAYGFRKEKNDYKFDTFGTFDHAISAYGTIGTEDVKYGLSKGKWEVEFTGIATAANGDMYSVVDLSLIHILNRAKKKHIRSLAMPVSFMMPCRMQLK